MVSVFSFSLFLTSLFPSWNRDFSKAREFGREVSSVGDVSSMKPKTVCAFYCLNFPLSLRGLLCVIYFLWFVNQKFGQEPQACKRTLIALDNHTFFYFFNYGNLWQLSLLASFIDKMICL